MGQGSSTLVAGALRDLQHAWRAIVRMPLLAAVVIVSTGVGIGVNTTIFSWIQAVLFRPLPGVADAASIHWVEARADAGAYPGVSWPEYHNLAERLPSIRNLLAFPMTPFNTGEPGKTEPLY